MFDFVISVFTIGYFKSSMKRCLRYYKLKFWPVPAAKKGTACVDATLFDLKGNQISLLNDILKVAPKSMPIILNMGSYT